LQRTVFEEQVKISESNNKPLIIHCVRSWDELLAVDKKLKPRQPWLIHGFRGSIELGASLVSRGFYLSFWFEFILRIESAALLRSLPADRIFLETDGSGVSIIEIYNKVATDLGLTRGELTERIYNNFCSFFSISADIQ
jgi:TatD DNase family protein